MGVQPSEAGDFQPYVGRAFHPEGASQALVLAEVEVGPPAPGPHRQPFTLLFRGAKPGPVVAEGLYSCRIEDGPSLPLYLIPIHTPKPDVQAYQSIFN